jgi:hypothetical protein
MLAPRWFQFKVGPLLRGETDLRTYSGMFRATQEEISGFERVWTLATCPQVEEAAADSRGGRSLVCFEGTGEYFRPLNGYNGVLKRELEKAVRPKWLDHAAQAPAAPIGIHVRLGDFQIAQSEMDLILRGGIRTPMSWYIDTLRYVRQCLGGNVPAFVVSDGRRQELADLVTMPGIEWIQTGSAISDLLLLSRAKVIIATGGSSFSAWASFLGECPILAVPGQSHTWFHLHHGNGAYVGEFHASKPPLEVQRHLTALASSL